MTLEIAGRTFFREISAAAHRKSSRFKSCTVRLLFFTRISSMVSDNLAFMALISVDGAIWGGNVVSLSAPESIVHNR